MSVNKKLAEKLSEYAVVKCEEPMRFHTTYRIGGPADYFIQPESADSLIRVIEILDEEQIPGWF